MLILDHCAGSVRLNPTRNISLPTAATRFDSFSGTSTGSPYQETDDVRDIEAIRDMVSRLAQTGVVPVMGSFEKLERVSKLEGRSRCSDSNPFAPSVPSRCCYPRSAIW